MLKLRTTNGIAVSKATIINASAYCCLCCWYIIPCVWEPRFNSGENFSTSASIDFPIVDYGNNTGIYLGPNLNPITIAQYSILTHEILKKQNGLNQTMVEMLKRDILVIGDWIKSHVEDRGNYSLLLYSLPFPPHNMTVFWYSEMAHSKAILAFMSAYKISNDVSYVMTADKSFSTHFSSR